MKFQGFLEFQEDLHPCTTYFSSVFAACFVFCVANDVAAAAGEVLPLTTFVVDCAALGVEKPNDKFFALAFWGSFLIGGGDAELEASDKSPSSFSSSLSAALPLRLDVLLPALSRLGGLVTTGFLATTYTQ